MIFEQKGPCSTTKLKYYTLRRNFCNIYTCTTKVECRNRTVIFLMSSKSTPLTPLPNCQIQRISKRELRMDLCLHFIRKLVSISGLSQQSPLGLGFGASIGLHEAKRSDPDTSKVISDDGFARN